MSSGEGLDFVRDRGFDELEGLGENGDHVFAHLTRHGEQHHVLAHGELAALGDLDLHVEDAGAAPLPPPELAALSLKSIEAGDQLPFSAFLISASSDS